MLNKKSLLALILLIGSSLLVYSKPEQKDSRKYLVKIKHKTKELEVKLCFHQAPQYMYATTTTAKNLITNPRWNGQTGSKKLTQKNNRLPLPEGQQGCLNYQINAKKTTGRLRSEAFERQHPEGFILPISSWLWLTADFSPAKAQRIDFKHDKNISVSAPWKLINRSNNTSSYLMKHTPDNWGGYVAFGEFEIVNLQIKQTRIRLALINGKNKFDKNQTTEWIAQMAKAVASIADEFPVKDLQVMVVFMRGAQEVVPWGQVNRAGASGVLFVTNPDASKAELMSDWTAAHEFSHLLLPYTPSDRWLSEGFASYHQNISRAKAGLIDEKTTWKKLLLGFARGKKNAQSFDAPKLKYADQKHNMQMYWGGAVIALKADVALQELSGGLFGLSKAISHLSDCCLETGRAWTAKETFEQLDLISNSKIFSKLYHNEVKTDRFPEYQQLLKDLGITNTRYGGIHLNDQAKKAKIRKKIISQKS